ncbi:hypothetical protein NPX13_g357 [Xylaria arbuscula]|uniref:NAD-dependent epimerase/dehydratase domain-containing protein n=1 Tax=Xylaria arbuscula TaxID=114810 RepID=A0A9W8NNF3_9PEZI|nr:hypothetical protein NPX13_g357 [Xylaria arbuscula]
MSSPNLLLTGATGLIGFSVLLKALEQGYKVRAAVRSASKAEYLAKHPKIVALGRSDQLSFIEVPDITAEEAYYEAIKEVTYVIHLAAPLPSPSLDMITDIYEPNVRSAVNILHAAIKEPLVKKVVTTSSIAGNLPPTPSSNKITAESRTPNFPGPYTSHMQAYAAGKVAALNAMDKFVVDNNPSFDVVKVYPGFVFGRDERALKPQDLVSGSNALVLGSITGQQGANDLPSGVVHIEDTANLFLWGLKPDAPANIGATIYGVLSDAWDIVKTHFPKAVEDGIFTEGSWSNYKIDWDSTQTETHFGFRFKSFEEMVVDVAGQYLELLAKEKSHSASL